MAGCTDLRQHMEFVSSVTRREVTKREVTKRDAGCGDW